MNRYTYALNDPANLLDPSGLDDTSSCSGGSDPDDDTGGEQSCAVSGGTGTNGGAPSLGAFTLQIFVFDWGSYWGSLDSTTYTGFNSFTGLGPGMPQLGHGGLGPNNGRNCSAGPASAGQYAAATAQVAALTAEFASGLGPTNQTFGPGTATSAVMGQSAGVTEALGAYMFTGQTSGLYTFGASGAYVAGGNPVAQFIGSFRWSISGGVLSVTNTTSLRSLTYDHGPQ